jgi:hypothetical protein
MLILSISFPDLVKFPYFMDTPKKRFGSKEAQRQGDFTNNFSIYTYNPLPPQTFTRGCNHRTSEILINYHWCKNVAKQNTVSNEFLLTFFVLRSNFRKGITAHKAQPTSWNNKSDDSISQER